jgi:transposase-like protein
VPKPFPPEFRRDVIAVARRGEVSISQVARDFGISESCLQRWLKIADTDPGSPLRAATEAYRSTRWTVNSPPRTFPSR